MDFKSLLIRHDTYEISKIYKFLNKFIKDINDMKYIFLGLVYLKRTKMSSQFIKCIK